MVINIPNSQTLQKTNESKPSYMVFGQNDRMAGSVPVRSFAENLADADGQKSAATDFGFSDIIDMVNPLQHIPIVSNLYQSATGDTIGAIAQIIGGAIFGGPIGALTGAGMVALKAAKNSPDISPQLYPEGTTVTLANLRQGYDPYNS